MWGDASLLILEHIVRKQNDGLQVGVFSKYLEQCQEENFLAPGMEERPTLEREREILWKVKRIAIGNTVKNQAQEWGLSL